MKIFGKKFFSNFIFDGFFSVGKMVRTKNTKNLPQYSASVLCEHCSEKFISNDVKENHVNEEHLAKIVKLKMKCDFCQKTFSKLTRQRFGFCSDTQT